MEFNGVKKAAFQIGSRPAQDELIRQAEQRRLMSVQNQMAMLDKRLSDAAMAKRKNQFGDKLTGMIDLDDPLAVAAIAGLAGQMSSAEQARGRGQENTIRQHGVDMIGELVAAGRGPQGDEADLLNAIIGGSSGKLLGPTNQRVDEQAQADVDAQKAQAEQRRAPKAGATAAGVKVKPLNQNVLSTMIFGKYGDRVPEIIGDFQAFAGAMQSVDPKYADERLAWIDYTRQYPEGGFLADMATKAIGDFGGGQPAPIETDLTPYANMSLDELQAMAAEAIANGASEEAVAARMAKIQELRGGQ